MAQDLKKRQALGLVLIMVGSVGLGAALSRGLGWRIVLEACAMTLLCFLAGMTMVIVDERLKAGRQKVQE